MSKKNHVSRPLRYDVLDSFTATIFFGTFYQGPCVQILYTLLLTILILVWIIFCVRELMSCTEMCTQMYWSESRNPVDFMTGVVYSAKLGSGYFLQIEFYFFDNIKIFLYRWQVWWFLCVQTSVYVTVDLLNLKIKMAYVVLIL